MKSPWKPDSNHEKLFYEEASIEIQEIKIYYFLSHFEGIDNRPIRIQEILQKLDSAVSLQNKPKLLITQACRGSEYVLCIQYI